MATLYIVRHGDEIDGFRGGWSSVTLNRTGLEKSKALACFFRDNQQQLKIKKIYSSDLKRAIQTSTEISNTLNLPIYEKANFREVNNGALAGMSNEDAEEQYPNLFWRNLRWDEKYPEGESPKDFFERVSKEWKIFRETVRESGENTILVTHGGVIQIILSLITGKPYTNKKLSFPVSCCDIIKIEFE